MTTLFDAIWTRIQSNLTWLKNNKADSTHTHSQYLTSHQDISGKANTADLATVATSGSYNDLTNKPTIPSNYVTTDTTQDITGRKTFIGDKKIYFKQSTSTDKAGFTIYNSSSAEVGALEYRPNAIDSNALLNLNTSSSGSTLIGFRYWGTTAINIIAPKASGGNYYIPVRFKNGSNVTMASATGIVNLSTLGFLTSTSLTGYQKTSNLVTSISSSSTNSQYPSAKCVYDLIGNIETLLSEV